MKKTTTRFCLNEKKALLQTEVHQALSQIPDWRDQSGRKGFCEALSTARIASGGGSVSNLSGVVRKPHVPSSMAYILYALFTLLILTCLISPHQISILYLLPKRRKKMKKTLWVDIMFHSAWVVISASPLHRFFVFVFLLEFLICKREKMRSYHSLTHRPVSSQRVVRYHKGTGRRPCYATLRCATICYACSMWWPLLKCRDVVRGIISVQRRAPCVSAGPRLNVHNLSSNKKKVPHISFKGQIFTKWAQNWIWLSPFSFWSKQMLCLINYPVQH